MMLTKIRYPLFYTLLIITSRPCEQICPCIIVHLFLALLLKLATFLISVCHNLHALIFYVTLTFLQGYHRLYYLHGHLVDHSFPSCNRDSPCDSWVVDFKVLLKLSCFFIACKSCLQNISKLYLILNPGNRAKLMWIQNFCDARHWSKSFPWLWNFRGT